MKKLITLSLFLFAATLLNAQVLPKMQSVFIYNFTKYIQWPEPYRQGDFVIGVLGGNAAITSELQEMARSKRAGNQPIVVKEFGSPGEISRCHILFIPENKSTQISQALSKIGSNSTLVVTEKEGYARKGAVINFVIRDSKQKFELNVANAQKQGLVVLQSLKNLAIIVN